MSFRLVRIVLPTVFFIVFFSGIPRPKKVQDVNWHECLDVKFFIERLIDEFDEECDNTEFRFQAKRTRSFHTEQTDRCIVLQKIDLAISEIQNKCKQCNELLRVFQTASKLNGKELRAYLEQFNERLEEKLEKGGSCTTL